MMFAVLGIMLAELLGLSSISNQTYGQASQNVQVKILIPNYGFEKNVSVIFRHEGGAPQTVVARYHGPADPGHEIWEAYANLGPGDQQVTVDYAEAPKLEPEPTWIMRAGAGPVLYGDRQVLAIYDEAVMNHDAVILHAAVKNLAYDKQVQVHYSTDGWQSEQTMDLVYQPVFQRGSGRVALPNAEGFEVWSGRPQLSADTTQLDYYLTYTVAGQVFTDTNFGHNYNLQIR